MAGCPTCNSDRCGNHAACARRAEAKLKDMVRQMICLAEWSALWSTITMCERTLEGLGVQRGDWLRCTVALVAMQGRAEAFYRDRFDVMMKIAKEAVAAKGGA